MSQKSEIAAQSTIASEDIPIEKLVKQQLKDKRKQQNKKRIKIWGSVFFVLFIWYAYNSMITPYQLSYDYALCKAYMEYNVPYPHTAQVIEVNWVPDGSMRLWYRQIDPFGEFRVQKFHCYYTKDPQTNALRFSKIIMGSIELDPKVIESYNKTIDIMASLDLNFDYPAPLEGAVEDLEFNAYDSYKIKLTDIIKTE